MATRPEWLAWLKIYKKYIKDCEAYAKQMRTKVLSLVSDETDLGPGSNPPPPPPPPPPH